MKNTIDNIYDIWLECMNSNFEERFLEPIIKRYSYWHGGTSDSVESKDVRLMQLMRCIFMRSF